MGETFQESSNLEYCNQDHIEYRKDLCISHTFLLKFQAENRGCGLYTRPLLSQGVNWLVGVIN